MRSSEFGVRKHLEGERRNPKLVGTVGPYSFRMYFKSAISNPKFHSNVPCKNHRPVSFSRKSQKRSPVVVSTR